MFILLFLFFLIVVVYNFNTIRTNRVLVQKIVTYLEVAIKGAEEHARLIAKKTGTPLSENDKMTLALEKLRLYLNVLDVASAEDKLDILSLITVVYKSKAEFKKKATEAVYDLLTSKYSTLDEEKSYHLTYIFNRFLKEMIENPLAACSNLVFRLVKFLINFHYLRNTINR